jgi:hypothetical protein
MAEQLERRPAPAPKRDEARGERGDDAARPMAPALKKDSRFAVGMTFSPAGVERSGSYEIWGKPIEVPIAAVPGLNVMVNPGVSVKVASGVAWNKKRVQTTLGVDGSVLIGLSYGNSYLASVYGGVSADASGGFTYTRTKAAKANAKPSWSLEGAIAVSGSVKVGVTLAGGAIDESIELAKLPIGSLYGLRWENGRFLRDRVAWEWSSTMKELFKRVRAVIEKGKRIVRALIEAGKRIPQAGKRVAKEVGEFGARVVDKGGEVAGWVGDRAGDVVDGAKAIGGGIKDGVGKARDVLPF